MQDSIIPNKGSRPHKTVSCALREQGQQLPHAPSRSLRSRAGDKSRLVLAPHPLLQSWGSGDQREWSGGRFLSGITLGLDNSTGS